MNNLIKESQGLVDKDGIQWYDLSDLITDYVYDLQNGLNADPFYDGGDAEISIKQIESYYQYKNSKKIPSYIIPEWIGEFVIKILKDKASSGSFLRGQAILKNNKLNFTIEISGKINNPDGFNSTLVHEFQHAYTCWINLSKKLKYNRQTSDLYAKSTQAFDDSKYGENFHQLATQDFVDLIKVNNEIFKNPKYLERTLLSSFYYAEDSEIRSFIQEYAADIMQAIKRNITDIKKQIKQSLEFKGNFNNIPKSEQYQSNILNNLTINYYSSKYYKIYWSYYLFYKKLANMNIDEDVAYEAIKNASKAIKLFLGINMTKKLVNFSGDENAVLKQIAKKQIPIYEKVLKKMQKIFVKLIMEIPV